MVTPEWRWVGILNTNLPLMKRNIYHPAIGCSCGLHTWPTLLQSVCNSICIHMKKKVKEHFEPQFHVLKILLPVTWRWILDF